eukprot:TRINITY_DN9883_c0_g1_i1.p1 TRINITY_DN9883_c0_g1~~TRINITY_DN9883_c0_g1_i1.p1  ORF type:complete len:214 (-),score=66.05 TRINITY_DN9883_c0_g1_i1:180-821(-)
MERETMESELKSAKLALKRAEASVAWVKTTLQEEREKHGNYRSEAAKTIRSLCNQLLSASANQDEEEPALVYVPEMRQMVAQHAQLMERLESVAPLKEELQTAEAAIAECDQLEAELAAARAEEIQLEIALKEAQHVHDRQQVGVVSEEQRQLEEALRAELDHTEQLQQSTRAQLEEAKSFLALRTKFESLSNKVDGSRTQQRGMDAVLAAYN